MAALHDDHLAAKPGAIPPPTRWSVPRQCRIPAVRSPQQLVAVRVDQDLGRRHFLRLAALGLAGATAFAQSAAADASAEFDVRSFGATGDGNTLDTPAINRAIDAAAAAGGGTVRFPRAPTPATPSA